MLRLLRISISTVSHPEMFSFSKGPPRLCHHSSEVRPGGGAGPLEGSAEASLRTVLRV